MVFRGVKKGAVNRAIQVDQLASGKGVNCARVLKALGKKVHLLTFAGGSYGSLLVEAIKKEALESTIVWTKAETRSCCTVIDEKSRETTELIENAATVSRAELLKFTKAFKKLSRKATVVVFIGTLPRGVRSSYYADLLPKRDAVRKFKLIVDTQKDALLALLEKNPDIVKVNREEWAEALRQRRTRQTQSKSNFVILTDARRKTEVVTKDKRFHILPPRIKEVNPIGCGDSMCAGLAYALGEGWSLQDCLRFGTACGSANAASTGYGRIRRAEIMKVFKSLNRK